MRGKSIVIALVLVALLTGSCAPTEAPTPTLLAVAATPTSALLATAAVPTATPPAVAEGQEAINDVSLTGAIELTGQWRFRQVDALSDELIRPEYDDSGWEQVRAPAPWSEQGLGKWVGQAKLVVYRRQVEVPADWEGKRIGISAWFNPHDSSVFVNGQRVEPARKPFAPYADVSQLLKYGQTNTIVVTTLYDGIINMAEAGPARLGPIEQRAVTRVVQEDVTIPAKGGQADAALVRPAAGQKRPALVFIGVGSHGMGLKTDWLELASDLARQGYVSLAVALVRQEPEGALAAVNYLRAVPAVDPASIVLVGADKGGETVILAAIQDPQISGIVVMSGPQVDAAAQLGQRPILFLAAEGDRQGLVLEQALAMAKLAQGPCQVVALPGNGHGVYVLPNAWNATRQALLDWLQQNLK